MKWARDPRVKKLKALYGEHDALETALIHRTRRGANVTGIWWAHDELERDIIRLEACLPEDVVELLREGEL